MDKLKKDALEIIKEFQPINIYQLKKHLRNVAYSTAWNLVKDLERDNKITVEEKRMKIIKLIRIKEND